MDTTEDPSAPSTLAEEVIEVPGPVTTPESVGVIQDATTTAQATAQVSGSPTTPETTEEIVDPHVELPNAIPMPSRKRYRLLTKWYLVRFKKDSVLHVCPEKAFMYRRRKRDRKIVPFGKYGCNWYECVLLAEDSKKTYLQQELHAAKKRSSTAIGRRGRKTGDFCLVQFHPTRDYQLLPSSELGDLDASGYCPIKCPDGASRLAMIIQRGTFEDLASRLAEFRSFHDLTTPDKRRRRHPSVPYTPRVRVPLLLNKLTPSRHFQSSPVLQLSPGQSSTFQVYPRIAKSSPDYERSPGRNRCQDSQKSPRRPRFLTVQSSPLRHLSPLLHKPSAYNSPPHFKRSASMQSTSSCKSVVALPSRKRLFDASPSGSPLKCEEPVKDVKDLGILTLPSPEGRQDDSPHSVADPFSTDSDTDYQPPHTFSTDSSPAPSISSELERSISSVIFDKSEAFSESSPATSAHATPQKEMKAKFQPHDDDIHTAGPSSTKKTRQHYKRKPSACLYCNRLYVRIQRHLATVHKVHPQVVQAMSITDKHERKLAWKKLRLEGNYKYNCGVTQSGEGELILQRANPKYQKKDYLPCKNCKGLFKRQSLYKHTCTRTRMRYERVQSLSLLSLPEGVFQNTLSRQGLRLLSSLVYPKMKADSITSTAQADQMIVLWGVHYCATRMQERSKAYLSKVASRKMRELARLLMALQKTHGDRSTLRSFLVPQRFDDLVDGTAIASGLKEGQYLAPSLPISLGYTLKTCASILQGEASRTQNDLLYESSERFSRLIHDDWNSQLTARATRQLKKIKFQKRSTKLLPLANDVMIFSQFLEREESRLVQNLATEYNYPDWAQLSRVLLCSLIVFNRKRVGDVEKIQTTSFQNKCEASRDSAIYEALNESEKLSASYFRHFYTTGKKDSQVPVMVRVRQIPAFDLIISLRQKAGVADGNMFLFGHGEDSFFDGCYAMRTLSKQSGAKNYELLRSTALRKQIATISQVMNMKSGDLDVLSTYLGHTIDTHRRYYRLQEEGLHMATVSRLLTAASTGDVESIRGKSLDELPPVDINTRVFYSEEENSSDQEAIDEDCTDSALCKASTSNFQRSEPEQSSSRSPKKSKRLCTPSGGTQVPQVRRPWSTAEKDAIRKHFSVCIEEGKVPIKAEVVCCLQQEPILRCRSWRMIKDCVRNMGVTLGRRRAKH